MARIWIIPGGIRAAAVKILDRPTGDLFHQRKSVFLTAVVIKVHETAERFIVGVMWRNRVARVIEISIGPDGFPPFGHEVGGFVEDGLISSGLIHASHGAQPLSQGVAYVMAVPTG